MTAAEMVKALGGKNGNCRCPAHDDKTPSLSITDGPDGQLLTHCFAGCSPEAVWQALKDCESVGKSADVCGYRVAANGRMSRHSEPDRRAEALAFWEASRPALHTPAQDYLACRGIVIQPPACIRYHGAENALVAAIQAHDGTLTGVQRIYLATDRRGTWKSGRYSLGPIKGGAVRLTPAAESIQLCESISSDIPFCYKLSFGNFSKCHEDYASSE